MAIATALARSRLIQNGLVMAAFLAAMTSLLAQSPSTAGISGRVVDRVTGRPIARAHVSLSPRSGGSIGPIPSDDDGRFVFAGLKTDAYVVVVVATGYLPSSRSRISDRTTMWIDVATAESIKGIEVALERATLVFGEVTTESGPLPDSVVIAMRPTVRSGLSFQTAGQGDVGVDGRFQIAGLTPGSYLFALRRKTLAAPLQFFAGAGLASQALRFDLKSGDHLQLPAWRLQPLEGFSISGKLFDDVGQPIAGGLLRLSPGQRADVADIALSEASIDSTGTFTFTSVSPGSYLLDFVKLPPALGTRDQLAPTERRGFLSGKPLAPTSEEATLWIVDPVSVLDRAVTGLALHAERGARIRVVARFQGAAPGPDAVALSSNAVYFRRIGGLPADYPGARFEADGRATTIELPRGEYAFGLAGSFPGWTLESAMAGGRESLGRTFDSSVGEISLTFGDTPTRLTGVVRDSHGFPVSGAVVYVLSTERSDWSAVGLGGSRMFSVRADRDGRYECGPLAGDYSLVAAETGALAPSLLAPSALDDLVSKAKRVSVSKGKSASIDLTILRR